jgi:hypothetical protein
MAFQHADGVSELSRFDIDDVYERQVHDTQWVYMNDEYTTWNVDCMVAADGWKTRRCTE